MASVFFLTIRQLTGKWRVIILSVLAGLPVFSAWVAVGQSRGAPTIQEFELGVLSPILAGAILPLVVLAIGCVAFTNEIEDRTLANITLAPIPRWQIVVPKLLAVICVAGPFVGISAFFTAYLAYSADWLATIAVTVASVIGVATYSSAFLWLGLKSTRAIGYGLLYIVLWESLFSQFVTGIRFLSVRYYSMVLMHGFDERRFVMADDLSFGFAVVASSIVFFGFLLLSIRRLRYMDVP